MLDAGHDALRVAGILTLITVNHRGGNARNQVGVLAETFGRAAPTRIAGNVDGRREGHVQAIGAGLEGRDPRAVLDGRNVPARGQPQPNRKSSAMAMDDVVGEEHRDTQATAQRRLLHRTVFRADHRVEGGADTPCGHLFADALTRHVAANADQTQLADLFLQGHAADQIGDEGRFVIDRRRGSQQVGEDQGRGKSEVVQVFHRERHPGCESLFEWPPRYSESSRRAAGWCKKT